MARVFGFLSLLAVMAASGYTLVLKTQSGDLNPVQEMDEAALRGELASAQYVLGIVAGQLSQVHVLEGSYDAQLEFDKFPLVTLVRADQTVVLPRVQEDAHVLPRGPRRHRRRGHLLITRSSAAGSPPPPG